MSRSVGRLVIAAAIACAALASFGAGAVAATLHHQPGLEHGPPHPIKHHPKKPH